MTAANALPPADRSIEIYQPDAQVGELKLWRAPEEVLMEAQQAAAALQRRIAGKKKPVLFNGEQYIENDDWQMVANFFGYSPKIISTEFVEYGDVQGFKAIAELIHEHTGRVVGRGEALCLDEEDNWGERTKYEWQDNGRGKRVKVAVGTVNTPLFQLASMAQTRACNKAMSNKLKWVVSLAGYSTTPAEDMHDATMAPKSEPVADDLPTEIRRKPAQTAPAQPAATTTARPAPQTTTSQPVARQAAPQARAAVISEAQGRRFYALWHSAGKTKEEVQQYLREEHGISSDRDMTTARYQEACAWAERQSGVRW